MNVIPATLSASAPGAGVLPASASGAAPGVGPSFADVLRLLAGDTPAAQTSGRSPRAAGAGDGVHPITGAEASGDAVAAASASTDLTATMGATTVPVGLVLPPVTELPPAVVGGDAPASEDTALPTGRAGLPTSVPGLGTSPIPAVAVARGATTRLGAHAGGERAFVLPDVSADAATDVVNAPAEGDETERAELPGRMAGASTAPLERFDGATRAAERAARRPRDLTAVLGGEAPGTASVATRRGWPVPAHDGLELPQVERVAQADATVAPLAPPSTSPNPALASPASAPSTSVPTPASTSSSTPTSTSTSTWISPSPATPTAPLTGRGTAVEAVVAETAAAITPPAAALAARLATEAARAPGRASGAVSAFARRLDTGSAAASSLVPVDPVAAALSNAASGSVAAAALDLEGLVAELTGPVAPALAAALRGQHPGLAAALRAFQQAGAPVAADGSGETRSEPLTASLSHVVAAARGAAFAGGEAETMMSGGEAGPRPLTLSSLATAMMPPLGSDLRVGSGLGPSARLDTPTLDTLTPAEGDDVRAQLVQSIRVQWTGGAGEARVRLRPEHLGEVVATIKVEQGAVTATLQAERPDVRRWLEAHTQTLRDGLVEHGLKLDRLVVLTEPARGESRDDTHGRPRGRHPQQPQPRPRRPRADDGGATFELNT